MLNLPDIFFMCLTFLLIPYIYINYNYPKYCITYFVVNFTCIFNFRTYFSLWDFSSQIWWFLGGSFICKKAHSPGSLLPGTHDPQQDRDIPSSRVPTRCGDICSTSVTWGLVIPWPLLQTLTFSDLASSKSHWCL